MKAESRLPVINDMNTLYLYNSIKRNICAIIKRVTSPLLDGTPPLKIVDKFTYLGSSFASTEKVNESMDSYQ